MALDEEKQSLIAPQPVQQQKQQQKQQPIQQQQPQYYAQQPIQQQPQFIAPIKLSSHTVRDNGVCTFKTFSTSTSGEILSVMSPAEYHDSVESINKVIKTSRIINLVLSIVFTILVTIFICFEVTLILPEMSCIIAIVVLSVLYILVWFTFNRLVMTNLGKLLGHLNPKFKSRGISFTIKRKRFGRRTQFKTKIHYPPQVYVQTTTFIQPQQQPQMYYQPQQPQQH